MSYSWADKLKPFLPGCLFNTPENKTAVFDKFKKKGGVWVASGAAEGIDLPNDLCTLNLVPLLPRPNIEDDLVRRKLALPGGPKEYDLGVLRTVLQMAGRASRHEEDYSKIITADLSLFSLIDKYRNELPRSFIEQIRR